MVSEVSGMASQVSGEVRGAIDGGTTGETSGVIGGAACELAGERRCRAAGDAALQVEVALGELAAGLRLAKAEVRRMRAAAAGWAARGAWASGHPSIPR